MNFRVFPSIVTTDSNWRHKIEEVKSLGLAEVAYFPTCLSQSEREEASKLLESSGISHIPLVHLRSDMKPSEVEYFVTNFGTRVFNIHSPLDERFVYNNGLSKYKNMIFVENSSYPWEDTLENWAGICLDVTHLESNTITKEAVLNDWKRGLEKYKVGVWHVSAIYDPPLYVKEFDQKMYDIHLFKDVSQLDYVKKYSGYLPEIVALELENDIKDQLKAKEHLEKILS